MQTSDYVNLFESFELLKADEMSRSYAATEKGTGREIYIAVFYKNAPSGTVLSISPPDFDFPGLSTIYDVAEDSKFLMIPEEIVGRANLLTYLLPNPLLTEAKISNIAKCVLQSVKFLHERGIVVRNISFNSILVSDDKDYPYKLKDYILAKLFDKMNFCFAFVYEQFAAPEIIQGKEYNKSSDIWSLGVVLFILMSGKEPFPVENVREFTHIDDSTIDFESGVWEKISEEGKGIVRAMLKVNPEERITVDELLELPWMNGECPNYDLIDAVPDLQRTLMNYRLRCALGAAKSAHHFKNFTKRE